MQKAQSSPSEDSTSEPLIPGLPDDVATLCLLGVPADAHIPCKQVSKGWNSIFKSNGRFSTLRKQFGFQDPWLVVFAYDEKTDMIHVKVLNLATLLWHTVHVAPNLDRHGEHEQIQILDPRDEETAWEPFPDHMRACGDFRGVSVRDGKLFLTNYIDVAMGRIYEPRTDVWGGMADQLREGLRADSCVEMDGHLFDLAPDNESRLRVYDAKSDSWDIVEGTTEGIPLSYWERSFASCLYSWDSKIYVVKDVLKVVVGDISRITDTSKSCSNSGSSEEKCRFRVRWEMVVDAPPSGDVDLEAMCAKVIIAKR